MSAPSHSHRPAPCINHLTPRAARHAFTLIELLIVVAIIAILAAIALPNFLEAQVRAKTARVKADHRTLATALEAYAVDYNHYPPEGNPHVSGQAIAQNADASVCLVRLTSPVSYLSDVAALQCPFIHQGGAWNKTLNQPISLRHYYYTNYLHFLPVRNPAVAPPDSRIFRAWGLSSLGPDRGDDGILWQPVQSTFTTNKLYDPTNGTMSAGDIPRFGGAIPSRIASGLNPR